MVDVRTAVIVWLPMIAWMAVIFHYSLMANVPAPAGTDISYLHLPAYFVLSALFLRIFLRAGRSHAFTMAIASSTLYGLIMEILQPLALFRSFSITDIILNLAGSCLVAVLLTRKLDMAKRALAQY